MASQRPLSSALFISFLAFVFTFRETSYAKDRGDHCPPSSCGNILNISHPFRLQTAPKNCGDLRYNLSCENNETVLYLGSVKFYVQAINYNNYTIRLSQYPKVQKGNCSFVPSHSFGPYNLRSIDPSYEDRIYTKFGSQRFLKGPRIIELTEGFMFVGCENPVNSPLYIDTSPCIRESDLSLTRRHSYVLLYNRELIVSEFVASCRVDRTGLIKPRHRSRNNKRISYMDIHGELVYGFELSWLQSYNKRGSRWISCDVGDSDVVQCYSSCGLAYGTIVCGRKERLVAFIVHYKTGFLVLAGLLAARMIFGALCAITIFIFQWRRRHLSMYDYIEEFLQSHNNLMPIRYSYSDIKKMAKGFKDKLGEGGYGSVYKGTLRSGSLVAIKMLDKSQANGQDFINEVATIGRIHHVNIVQLIGFCVEGSKRALVYDFMPNGSLDKHIFSREGNHDPLISCDKMLEISLGVARGIEYLHRGCEMQILHFDIKPHNILLDENFMPKVSDFGLARLCPLNDNIVSLTAARGTLGYIAPELFYKNIGGVSYKADVYSFGMLLMELASGRKNLNPVAEKSSQIHFPSWVSDQFSSGKQIDMGDATEEEAKTIKKMMIVALWCIQLKPCDRPSMNKVVEMLEQEVECLQMPPSKFSFYPTEVLVDDASDSSYTRSSASSDDESASLVLNAN